MFEVINVIIILERSWFYMEKQIIVINGTGGSGKDTFVELCSKYCKVFNFSSIDKIKEIAKLLGWDGGKTEKDRKFLSDLKDLSTKYNDMPYESIKNAINDFYKTDDLIMFIHVREPKEISRIVTDFKAKTVLIKRKKHKIITSNFSDANVENYNYDYIIKNDTIKALDLSAKKFVSEIISNK